jgi:exonuclease SbcD
MRFLHSSDWHLGQTLHHFDRHYEHDRFLDWLLETLVAEQVDALLVAGDVFDNANPAPSCQRRLFEFLATLRRRLPDLSIVLIAGNHDSAGRLEAPSPLLDAFGIHVVGQPARREDGSLDLAPLVLPLQCRGETAAWCLAVPFLRPGDVPRVAAAEDAYSAGIASLYREALALALAHRRPGQAIVAMGHCHLAGGATSEQSERRIVIGGAEAMPASIFGPEIAYVALGHLHLAQTVAHPTRRYSGSPLPLSFAEIDYPHQVVLVDLDGETVSAIRAIPVPRPVPLMRIPGRPAPIDSVLAELAALVLPDMPEAARPYLEVRVLLEAPEPALRVRIEEALAGKPVRLARIDMHWRRNEAESERDEMSFDDLARLAPADIFDRAYRQRYGSEPPPALHAALAELIHESDAAGA